MQKNMIIFYANFGGQGGWRLHALPLVLVLIQILLNSERSLGLVVGYTIFALACLAITLTALIGQNDQRGWWGTLQRALTFHWRGGGGGVGQPPQGRPGAQRSHTERIESVRTTVSKLPIELYRTEKELNALSVAELKALLKSTSGGAQTRPCLEKRDLVQEIIDNTNSTAQTCTICCEDYAGGDVLRVLKCRHRFHLECIDRWFLSSADYTRPPACPVCNAELEPS